MSEGAIRNLHIGGEEKTPGWEVLNANPAPYVDHVCNANDLSQFDDNTFQKVYASHVLEHFDYKDEISKVLDEWYRVLVPGGKIFISVPDLDVLCRLILDKENFNIQQHFFIMRMLFGGHVDKYDYHVIGLNQDFLCGYLQQAGFVNMWRMSRFDFFDDTSAMSYKGVPISLNIVAEKPLP